MQDALQAALPTLAEFRTEEQFLDSLPSKQAAAVVSSASKGKTSPSSALAAHVTKAVDDEDGAELESEAGGSGTEDHATGG